MEKKTKIILGVGLAVVAAAGVYLAITKPWVKADDAPAADDTKPTDDTPKQSGGGGARTTTKGGIAVTKAAPKAAPFTPVKSSSKPLWVYAKTGGVKTYKKSGVRGVQLGGLYNTYSSGKIIGKFAGTTSIGGQKYLAVLDGNNSILVPENLTYQKSI